MDEFKIYCDWPTLPYKFPGRFTPEFRREFSRPEIYRWRIMRGLNEPSKEPIYIGEAGDLVQRIQGVITPRKEYKVGDTNYKLGNLFRKQIATGKTVVLDRARITEFQINGERYGGGEKLVQLPCSTGKAALAPPLAFPALQGEP